MSTTTKIFISWSGSPSREIALQLKAWLEEVYDGLEAFVSDRDIEAGARSMKVIEDSLAGARAGVIVVTRRNMDKPWINFEAGALSKALGEAADHNRVIPLLVDFERPAQLRGPMSILQAVMLDREGVGSMLRSINTVMGLDHTRAETKLQRFWDDFEKDVLPFRQQAFDSHEDDPVPASAGANDETHTMIPEILEILRGIRDRPAGPPVADRNSLFDGLEFGPSPAGKDANIVRFMSDRVEQWVRASGLEEKLGLYQLHLNYVANDRKYEFAVIATGSLSDTEASTLSSDLRHYLGGDDIVVLSRPSLDDYDYKERF